MRQINLITILALTPLIFCCSDANKDYNTQSNAQNKIVSPLPPIVEKTSLQSKVIDTIPDYVLDRIVKSKYFKDLEIPYRQKGGLKFILERIQEDSLYKIRIIEDFDNSVRVVKNLFYSSKSSSIYEYDPFDDVLLFLFKI